MCPGLNKVQIKKKKKAEKITSPAGAAMLHILQTTRLAHPSTCTLLFIAFCFLADKIKIGSLRYISQASAGFDLQLRIVEAARWV
jgi:hypothetical protein